MTMATSTDLLKAALGQTVEGSWVAANYAKEDDARAGWASAIVAFLKTMSRLPGTDAILDGLEPAINAALVGFSETATPPGPQGALKLQTAFAQAWLGISANAASLYTGAASATPPPTVATIAGTLLPPVFSANNVPGLEAETAAGALASALGGASATGGLWVLSAGGTAPIV